MPQPPLTFDEMSETVQATLTALDASRSTSARVAESGRAYCRVILGTGYVTCTFVIEDDQIEAWRLHDGTAHNHDTWRASELTRASLSSRIYRFILGVSYLPPDSRKHVRRIIEVAQMNAANEYRQGMNHIIRGNPVDGWDFADSAERWDAVVSAAFEARNGGPSGFMWYYRKCGVALHAFDIYDDAYIETAYDLMSALEVA